MFIHDGSIALPKLKQRNLPSGRVYEVVGSKAVYPSITRVLAAKPKPALDAWRARVGHAEANKISARATAAGTSLHHLAEQHLKNGELPSVGPHVQELWRFVKPWLDEHVTRVYEQEADVFSERLGAAGRFDLLAEIDAKDLSIVDFKTSGKPKIEKWMQDYYLQGTFYSCALYELTGRRARRIIFPVISPEGLQVFETNPMAHLDELVERIDEFYATNGLAVTA